MHRNWQLPEVERRPSIRVGLSCVGAQLRNLYHMGLALAKKCVLAAPAILLQLHPNLLDLPWSHDNDDSAETAVALMCGHQSSGALRSAGPGASNVGCHCLFERRMSHHLCFKSGPYRPLILISIPGVYVNQEYGETVSSRDHSAYH